MSRGSASEEFGPYLVYEELGAGGMAHVHRAEQAGIEGFRKVVALKRMLPHVAANEDMVKSFVREARLASFLRHANVAQTYDLGKVGDIYFIAMELIEGRSLREILRRCAQLDKVMPVAYSLNILNQICDALDYAHNLKDNEGTPLGIIHRDVSPSNVILAEDGVVKLIDFGIAKASGAGMQTMSGTIKGKYGYMAPEYLAGRIDARADLFAIGVIAHELLTNRALFTTSDDIDTLQRVREMPIAPPSRRNPAVPPEIDDVVMTALERDPDRRWQHATALRAAMTTLTKRLGLQVTNQEVVSWLDNLDFDSATLPFGGQGSSGDSVIISVEQGTAHTAMKTPVTVHLGAAPILPMPAKAIPMPAGTPSRISAQRSIDLRTPSGSAARSASAELAIQPSLPPKELQTNDEYEEAVRRYERHEALIPSGTFLADEIVPTQVRTSSPQIKPPPLEADPVRASLPTMVEMPAPPPIAVRSARASGAAIAVPDVSRASAPAIALPDASRASGAAISVRDASRASGAAIVLPESRQQGPITARPESALSPAPSPASTKLTAVLLVLLAAAVAGSAVYFLL